MMRGLGSLLAWSLVAAPATAQETSDPDVAESKRAEARAFAAVEEERWCDANHAFLAAHQAAPQLDLVYNAAQAADLGGDKQQAVQLYVELLGAYPDSARQAEVDERIRALSKELQSGVEGVPCPPPTEAAPDASVEADPAAEALPGAASAPPSVPPWTVAGAGVVLLAAGTGLAAFGSLPYFGFHDARAAILEAEKGGGDAAGLHDRQTASRESWESWGGPSVISGVALAVVGAGIVVGGIAWALLAGGAEEAAE
jgi:hypothetical protein